MIRSPGTALSWLRVALLCSTAFAMVDATAALARVGVTSATNGDPLGKPPQEAERILRIGIDVQANEIITTGANDRAHLVFLDGTSLTVGPNAQLTIDKFVYDPNTKTGELAINASKGVLRLVGGKISKTNEITVATPSSTIGIRGGMCLISVENGRTTSTFLFGQHMRVHGHGQTQNVTRPGSQVTTNSGAPPSLPTLAAQGSLTGQMGQLEGSNSGGSGGNQGGQQGGGQGGGNQGGQNVGQNADRGAQQFGRTNSGQGPGGAGGPPGGNFNNPGQGQGSNNAQNAINNSGNQGRQNNNNNVTTTSTTTTVIITKGRYLNDPTYSGFSNNNAFNNNDLAVTADANNNKVITSPSNQNTTTTTTTTSSGTSTSTRKTITLNVPGVGSVDVLWQPGTLDNGYSLDNGKVLGTNVSSGTGYVSPKGDFFAFVFNVPGQKKLGIFGGTPTNTSGTTDFPTSGQVAFSIGNLGSSTRLPFANTAAGDDSDLQTKKVVGSLYSAYSSNLGATAGQTFADPRATAMQSTISIAGSGADQKSYMGVFIGQYLRDMKMVGGAITNDNGVALTGDFYGTYRLGGGENVTRLTSGVSTPLVGSGNNAGHAIYGTTGTGHDGPATGMILTPDKLTVTIDSFTNPQNVTPTNNAQAAYQQAYKTNGSSDYFSVNAAYSPTTLSGNTRTSQTQTGYVGGLVEQAGSNGNLTNSSGRVLGNTNPSDFQIQTSATNNRAQGDLTLSSWDTGVRAEFKLGSVTGSNDSTSAFIDDKRYAIADGNAGSRLTSIAGSTSNVTSNTVMVSYNSAAIDSLFTAAGVTKCSCDFLTWGWWSGDIGYASGSTYNAGGRDRLNLATYVAGNLATVSQLPNTGSATFNGHLVGNVQAGSNNYVAVGSYSSTFNWGSSSGNFNVTYDGTTFGQGTYTVQANTVQFSTGNSGGVAPTASVSGTTRTLNLNGAFFQSNNQVAGQAGNFNITSTGSGNNAYKAAGTFAAQKQ